MEIRTFILWILGLLTMSGTSVIGQFQVKRQESFSMKSPGLGQFPSPMNLPSPPNFPPNNQPGSFNPFDAISNFEKSLSSLIQPPLNQPGGASPNFPPVLPPPGPNPGGFNNPSNPGGFNNPSNPGGFNNPSNPGSFNNPSNPGGFNNPSNPGGFKNPSNPFQNFPPPNQQRNFGQSSNIPQNVPPSAPQRGFNPYTPQQNIPPGSHPGGVRPGGPPRQFPPRPNSPPQNFPKLPPPNYQPSSNLFNSPPQQPPSSGAPPSDSTNPVGQPPQPNGSTNPVGQPPQPNAPTNPVGPPPQPNASTNPVGPPPQPNGSTNPAGPPPQPNDSTNQQNQNPSSSNPNSSEPVSSSSENANNSSDTSKSPSSSASANADSNRHVPSKSRASSRLRSGGSRNSHPSGVHPVKDDNPLKDYRIVCLFNNKHYFRGGFTPSEIDPSLCTHVNYEFAILDPKSYEMMVGEPDLDITQNFYEEATDLRKANPKLKVLLSLGGWADSTKKYSEMAADEDKRKNFVEKAIPFLKSHEFDGMDLAWEYPNCWQGAIGINPKDKPNFVLLLKDLKAAFEKEGLILSVSVGAIKREVEAAYDVPGISATVDFINVMTYDMHGPWEPVTGHHVQFEKLPGDKDPYCNVKAALQFWVDQGADKKKLNMGLALYAKTFTLADASNNAMGAPAAGIGDPGPDSDEGGFLLYNEICPMLNAGNWTEAEDKNAGFYAYSGDQWACYDNPMMMVRKAKYVVEEGYGGVLMKDLGGDDYKGQCFSMNFPLLKMCRLEMIQRIRKKFHHKG